MRIPKFIPDKVSAKIGRQLLVLSKHSPNILFGVGVVGFVGTTVLAVRATTKVGEVFDHATDRMYTVENLKKQSEEGKSTIEYTDRQFRKDKIDIRLRTAGSITKLYGPVVIVGVASIGALTGSHVVLSRRYIGVTAAYAALERGMDEYRNRVIQEFGQEKDDEYRYGLVDKQIVESTKKGDIIKTIKVPGSKDGLGSPYARYFDEGSTLWKREDSYNQLTVRVQQAWANDVLQRHGYIFLNDVYKLLGLPITREGQVVGWLKDVSKLGGDGYVDFGVLDNWDKMRFVNGEERSVLLDFNVDGVIWNLI